MLQQPTSSADFELSSMSALNKDPDSGLGYATTPCKHKTAIQRIGRRALIILAITLVLELAVVSFITFLWISPQDNVFWHWLAINGWLTSAVTATSVVLRTAIDLQAGVAVAMLAALLLE
jgi:hypothetical protein